MRPPSFPAPAGMCENATNPNYHGPTVRALLTALDAWVDRGIEPPTSNYPGLRDGTLVPEDIRWIPATTQGRVERMVLRPGATVTPGSIILELSNPQLDQELQDAVLKLKGA